VDDVLNEKMQDVEFGIGVEDDEVDKEIDLDDLGGREAVIATPRTPKRAHDEWTANQSLKEGRLGKRGLEAALEAACPLYANGAGIHYYSATQQTWIPGFVQLSLRKLCEPADHK
jgi:hypothetical protein